MSELDAIVVGGGLAGLACAQDLAKEGHSTLLLEASDRVGGRVRTDQVDGFRLDRGFQVLLEAYPECRRRLDLPALELRRFYPGVLVRAEGAFHRLPDPSREMVDALRAIHAPVGSVADKLRVATLRHRLGQGPPDSVLEGDSVSTERALRDAGFSDEILERFFRPFLGGVLLDRSLQVSARLFRYYFRMFADGATSLPASGMEAIPRQLASTLPPGSVRTNTPVGEVGPGWVRTRDGDRLEARSVIVAVEGPEAARLLGGQILDPGSRPVVCLYFEAPESPVRDGILVLNGGERGPINHLAVLSQVAPEYAPEGRALVSVTLLPGTVEWPAPGRSLRRDGSANGTGAHRTGPPGPDLSQLERAARAQLTGWYGDVVSKWRTLTHYHIPHGQPLQTPDRLDPPSRPVRLAPGLLVAGDHRENASLNGALVSGKRAARELSRELQLA